MTPFTMDWKMIPTTSRVISTAISWCHNPSAAHPRGTPEIMVSKVKEAGGDDGAAAADAVEIKTVNLWTANRAPQDNTPQRVLEAMVRSSSVSSNGNRRINNEDTDHSSILHAHSLLSVDRHLNRS